MNKQLIFLFLLISFLKTQSQENRKFLYADVKDKIAGVYNAHIVNLNTKQGTFTNESGEFRILAKQHDSLQISFVGYKSTLLIVNLHHFGIQKNTFELVKTAFELDEISIKKNNLLGYLTSDSKNIKIEKKIDAKTLKLPYAGSRILTPAERRLYTAMGGRNLLSIDYIINSISGRITKLRKLKTIESLEVKVKNLKNTYSKHIVKEYHIKESDVYKFIYFCTADEHFNQVYNSGDINMILFLKKKSEVFKKLHSNNYN
ncbi:carboxypeptidase-like regulatory domain-containing protein [Tenacibaculum haliotis]|uniref:carboxypeptidase-like regulatory domain-containing protein n=1 Tax=Tenacibaculum haliotis TaxID=1888914 RepID=UPI0021AE77A8|nr:carboxypeptidase-like regulatory domain-containing protein [Tenacibaculum haliotis]MCT4698604.1 carboxypeptidase-like regulatory domain-containing protein [Tenacibaculum haliotis]